MSSRNPLKWIGLWNQRLHVYIGLFFLLFTWVFAFTGIILNHPKWSFTQFWSNRQESNAVHTVRVPTEGTDLERTRDLMRQLALSGEVTQITTKPDRFEFRLSTPAQFATVTVTPSSGRALVQQTRIDGWGVLNSLHHLTGVHGGSPALTRNSPATWAWSIALDAVSVGLLVLAIGGIYIWLRRREAIASGLVALTLGAICCGLFLFVL
jgi:uncharacterized protein